MTSGWSVNLCPATLTSKIYPDLTLLFPLTAITLVHGTTISPQSHCTSLLTDLLFGHCLMGRPPLLFSCKWSKFRLLSVPFMPLQDWLSPTSLSSLSLHSRLQLPGLLHPFSGPAHLLFVPPVWCPSDCLGAASCTPSSHSPPQTGLHQPPQLTPASASFHLTRRSSQPSSVLEIT